MIKEVIVVEGKQDVQAVHRAVNAECIVTGGFGLSPYCLQKIEQAYKKRGIIILTDPDSAGERIRNFLAQRFPEAKHAFVTKEQATANNDVGVEQASPQTIQSALARVRYLEWQPGNEFTWTDIMRAGLSGTANAANRRSIIGDALGIGYANAKSFLHRLNHYGVSRNEFNQALNNLTIRLEAEHDSAHHC